MRKVNNREEISYMNEKTRENWIDFVKLVAMLIVVMNHASCVVPLVSFWGGMFFVPVFFVLSGFTYHLRDESFSVVMYKKAKRLLAPYFVANFILFVFFLLKDVVLTHTKSVAQMLQSLVGVLYARNQIFTFAHQTLYLPAKQENYYLLTNLNSPTWFLPALFLTIFLFECCVRIMGNDLKKLWLTAAGGLLLGVVYYYVSPVLLMWSLDALPFFYLLFLVGYTMQRCDALHWFEQHILVAGLIVVGFLISAFINGSTNFSIAQYGKSITLALYNAVCSSALFMYICQKAKRWIPDFLGAAGRQTLFVLCYHMLLLSILMAVLPKLPLFVTVLITMTVLILVGIGKDKLIGSLRAGKRRRENNAKK